MLGRQRFNILTLALFTGAAFYGCAGRDMEKLERAPKPWPVWDVAFSHDGCWLAAGRGYHQYYVGGEGEVIVWKTKDWDHQEAFLAPFTDMTRTIAFTADSKFLIAASDKYIRDMVGGSPHDGNMVFIWTVPDDTLAKTLAINDQFDAQQGVNRGAGSVISLAISPDGELICLARLGSIPVILHRKTGELSYLDDHLGNSHGLAFSPNGRTLVSGTHMKPFIRLYNATSRKELANFDLEGGEPAFACVRFSPDGKQIAVGVSDGTVRLLAADLSKQLRVLEISAEKDKVQALAYAAKADLLAAATTTRVRLFEASTGKQLREWGKADLRASTVALSPDGKLLAVGYCGKHNVPGLYLVGYVNIWDTATGRLVKKLD